jgi:hypothetical protein
MTVYGDGGCSSSAATFTLVDGNCTNTNGGYGAKAPTVTPSGGTCAPSGGTLTADAPAWQLEALVCGGAASAGTCSAGICAVEPAEPFGPAVCIHKDGDEACPEGFPARTLVYAEFADTRSCTACNCGAPSGISCPINTFAGACGNMGIPLAPGNVCDNDNYYYVARLGPAIGGSCPVSGGEPSGSLDPISPITVCCAP